MSDSESIDLLEISELVRPITKQGMLYVTRNKLIETFVFDFELAFKWCNSFKSFIHLCHILKLHDYHPFGHVSNATESHFASGNSVALHFALRDQMIKETLHSVDPV